MLIDWDVPIEMDDGVVLRGDVFGPEEPGRYPVVLAQGVYGKGLPIQRLRRKLLRLAESLPEHVSAAPEALEAVTADAGQDIGADDHRVWEVVDPAQWVPHGYVCVRVDSRGSGRSPGVLDPVSPREIRDFAACIEWAGTQEWSNGRVGLNGKSYLALTQWLVAALQPPHLAAICVWHGLSDWYRDATRHGGILYQFWEEFWYPVEVLTVQHGLGRQAGTNPHSGRPIAGDDALDQAALAATRVDLAGDIRSHPLDDEYYRQRSPRLDQVRVPVLASADWSDHDLHLRGTIQGFLGAASTDTWLEVHAGGQFDDPAAVDLQRRFFDHYLKDHPTDHPEGPDAADGDWREQPRVQLAIRHADGTAAAYDTTAWPVPSTVWRPYHLDLRQGALLTEPVDAASQASYEARGQGVVLHSAPVGEDTTIAGPVSATLWVSSSTADADLFLVLDAVDPDEEVFELRDHRGGITAMSVGWLRASHRALDPARSTPGQPFHTHTSSEPLVLGQPYQVHVELRPTGLHLPAGHRLRLSVSGHGRLHDDPADRPAEVFDDTVTLHSGLGMPAHLLIPVVPVVPDVPDVPDVA